MNTYDRDRAEIADLMARYLFAMDYNDYDAYAECFTVDGVLDYAGGVSEGRATIRAEARVFKDNVARLFTTSEGKPAKLRHLVHQKAMRIEGDRAWHTGMWWEMTDGGPDGSLATPSFGTYQDELARIDGRWLFTRRRINNEFLEGRETGADNPVTALEPQE